MVDRWIGPGLIALTFVAMTRWSWRKWPDIIVDFGRELYIPWQLATGKALYVDIAYFNGPLSPYLNASWFRLFGVSLTILVLSNLAILAILTGLVYAIFIDYGRPTATMACLVLLCVFGFSQYLYTGNYNFVSPYSHELTHGVALSVAMIFCLDRYVRWRRSPLIVLAGVLFGLVCLTKAEVALAAGVAAVVGMGLVRSSGPSALQEMVGRVALFGGGALLPSALFLALLSARMPVAQALGGVAGTWTSLLGTSVASGQFFRWSMGLDHPFRHFALMARAFGAVSMLAGTLAALDFAMNAPTRDHQRRAVGAAAMLLAAFVILNRLAGAWLPKPWLLVGWALPGVTAAVGAALLAIRLRPSVEVDRTRNVALLMWIAFALVLLGKIALYPRVHHYGFALAMPAALTLVVGFVWLAPALLHRLFGGGRLFRWMAVIMISADVAFYLGVSKSLYARKDFPVGADGDVILTFGPDIDPKGLAIAEALAWIRANIPADRTLVVLPEGVMLNYLARRENSTPYVNFMPPEMTMFGEVHILASLKARPPDFVILVHKDTSEYGVGFFGAHSRYGKQIMDWVDANYSEVGQILAEPLRDGRFGIKMLKRRRQPQTGATPSASAPSNVEAWRPVSRQSSG